jgi:hypothetical protein
MRAAKLDTHSPQVALVLFTASLSDDHRVQRTSGLEQFLEQRIAHLSHQTQARFIADCGNAVMPAPAGRRPAIRTLLESGAEPMAKVGIPRRG